MVLASSGPLKFSQIRTEMGGTNPVKWSNYYANAASGYCANVTGIPNIGTPLSLSRFYGKQKLQPPQVVSGMTYTVPQVYASTYTTSVNISSIFSGTNLTYSATSPYGNTSMSGSTLYVTTSWRDPYTVTLTATNSVGSAQYGLVVTEGRCFTTGMGGTYTNCYFNSAPTVDVGNGFITMNSVSGNGTINSGAGVQTLTSTSWRTYTWVEPGISGTYNGTNTMSWDNGSTWIK